VTYSHLSTGDDDGVDPGSLYDQHQKEAVDEQRVGTPSDAGEVGSPPVQSRTPSPRPTSPQSSSTSDIANDYWQPEVEPVVDELKSSLDFIHALQNASLDDGGLSEEALRRLRNPPQHILEIDDPVELLSLRHFLGTSNASQHTYANVQKVHNDTFPEQPMLSYAQVRNKLEEWTGVESIINDMCPESCVAFTGPYSALDTCPRCQSARYDTKILRSSRGKSKKALLQFYTIPLGPQIQAIWRLQAGAEKMKHRQTRTKELLEMLGTNGALIEEYDDLYHGSDYLNACLRGDIKPNDTVLMHAMDGAQLYKDKESDCWILLWIILELSADFRYKKSHVYPGAVIPGAPKFMESFLFPGFYHVAGLQQEGLHIWDALDDDAFVSFPYYLLGVFFMSWPDISSLYSIYQAPVMAQEACT
jgi:hypothetical protein